MAASELVATDMLALGQPFGEKGDAIRNAAADKAMDSLADILAEPEYVGDVQTALIHHLRRDAFDWYLSDHMLPDYLKLEQRIAKAGEESDVPVPVVMSYQIHNGGGSQSNGGWPNFETALVAVDADKPHFHSTIEHKRDIQERGFAGPLAVTTRSISLLGSTVRLEGLDLGNHMRSGAGAPQGPRALEHWRSRHTGDEFVLHATKVTSGNNSVHPPDVAREAASTEVERFYSEQHPLVGWEAIVKFVSGSILNTFEAALRDDNQEGSSATLRYMGSLAGFFEEVGQLDALLENSPKRLRALFKHAASFRGTLQAIKLAERPPEPDYDD